MLHGICQHFVGRNIVHRLIVASHAVSRHQIPALRLIHRSHKALGADDGGTLGNAGHAVLIQKGSQCLTYAQFHDDFFCLKGRIGPQGLCCCPDSFLLRRGVRPEGMLYPVA